MCSENQYRFCQNSSLVNEHFIEKFILKSILYVADYASRLNVNTKGKWRDITDFMSYMACSWPAIFQPQVT